MISLLLVLSIAAWLIPSLTASLHTPASGHEHALSVVTAVLLLVLFALSIPASIARDEGEAARGASSTLVLSPLLIVALLLAAFVTVLVVTDGESNWLEGATLLVLYVLIAAAFWWG